MSLPANWTLVPSVSTPQLLEDAVTAFAVAWPRVIYEPLTAQGVGVAVAHCALECGNFGYRSGKPADPPTLYNNNLGNTRAAQGEDCNVCQYPGNEIIGGKVVRFKPPDPLSTFRAFDTFADGVAAQLDFLGRPQSRYHQAWLRLLVGDPAGFVQQLKAHGYFTGDEAPYEKAVVSIFSRVVPIAARVIDGQHHAVTDEDREHVAGLVALTSWQSAEDALHGSAPELFPLT